MNNARVGLIVALSMIFAAQAFAAPDDSAVEKGQKVYQKWCYPCHGTGSGKPATDLLAARDKGSRPAALEERTDLSAQAIKMFVRHGVMFMPTFRKTEISDADLDALSAYLTRNNKR